MVMVNALLSNIFLTFQTSIDLLLTAPQEIQLPDIFLPFKYTTFNKGAPISIAPYISFPKPMEDYQVKTHSDNAILVVNIFLD